MDGRTETLIRELADKLGTTTEHLWGVLVTQAPITAATDLIFVSLWAYILFIAFNWLRRKKPDTDNCEMVVLYAIGWAILATLGTVTFFVCAGMVTNAVTALLNPEYWALDTILRRL